MTTLPAGERPLGDASLEVALDALVSASSSSASEGERRQISDAAHALRTGIFELLTTQIALTEALIASQDRQLAVEALSRLNLRGTATDDTLALLLDRALAITGSRQALLIENRSIVLVRGETGVSDDHVALVLGSIADGPLDTFRAAAADTLAVGALDPEGEIERHVAFIRPRETPFSTPDVPLIEAIVSAMGIMLAFRELHRHEFERMAVEREHQVASVLAQSVIAAETPVADGLDIFARTVPAALTGGDFYVFGQSSDTIWFAVGDVAGKGLPAAMLMTRAVAACRIAFLMHAEDSLLEVFRRVDDEMYGHLDDAGVFITLVIGVADTRTGEVRLVNAGHSPVVAVVDGVAEFIRSSVPPLGIVPGRIPRVSDVRLAEGDRLLVGSDGLTEQTDPRGEMFGFERFLRLSARGAADTDAFGDQIFAAVRDFAAGEAASDDATLVMLTGRKGTRMTERVRSRLDIAPTLLATREIGDWLHGALDPLDDDGLRALLPRIELAVHEACVNAVEHGSPPPGTAIELELAVRGEWLTVTIVDHGGRFDPSTHERPPTEPFQERGYGLKIIRSIADRVTYRRVGSTNELELVIRTGEDDA